MWSGFEDKWVDEVIRTSKRAVDHESEEGEGRGSMVGERGGVSG